MIEFKNRLLNICAVFNRDGFGQKEVQTYNSTFTIDGVLSPLDSFMVAESSFLQTNFCTEKPAHR